MLKFFRSSANQRLVGRLLKESFRKHAATYGIAIVAMLVVAATTAASAWIMRDIANEFAGPKDIETIYLIAGAVATIFIVKGVATYVQALFLSRAGNSIIADRQRKIYDRMLEHGIEFYHSYSSADLIMRMTQSANAARSVVDILVTSFIRDLFSLIGLVLVMAIQQPMLSLVAFIFGPAAIFAVNKLLKRTKRIMEKELVSVSMIMRVMQETVFGARIVKSFNLESTMRNRMYGAVADVQRRANSIAALEAITSPIMETLAGLAIAGVILISGYLIVQGGHTPGSVMAFITALLLAYEPAKRLARARVSLEAGMVGVRLMYEIADRPLKLEEAPDAKPLSAGPGEIRFDDVSFSYREDEAVLNDLDIVFPAGQMTALVGASGGGKSTVLNLIMRLYDPDKGRVLFDGEDIKIATLHSVAREDRLCQPGHVPVRRDGHAQHPHGAAGRDRRGGRSPRRRRPTRMPSSWPCPRDTRRISARTACCSRAASGSASRSRGRCCAIRRSCCSTRRPARSTPSPRRCSATRWRICRKAARRSRSRTACPRFTAPTRSS